MSYHKGCCLVINNGVHPSVSIFLPMIFGLLGLIFALIGIKALVKVSLVLRNVLGVSLSLFLMWDSC